MFERLKMNSRLWKELDYTMLITSILIVLYGVISIYSIVGTLNAKKQLIWLILSLIITYIILHFDYRVLNNYIPIFYWGSIILLILNNYVLGSVVNGARGWIKLGPINIQSAEVAKLALTLMLAKKLDEMDGEINDIKNFFILTGYALIPMILIVVQPDMGMTMVCFFIVLGIFYAAGLNSKVILGGLISLVLLITIVWNSSLMPNYWKGRLSSFINPEKYESTYGHQIIQSQTAIGSGQILGTGFLKGKQLKFVPEAHTDSISAVIGEQWGFIGMLVLLGLYGILFYRIIKISITSKDIFGSMICVGIVSYFMFAIIENLGMNIGIMPVTGITLPLVSYGGSSLLTNYISLALVLNVGMRKKKINF
ncbi:rod shape-determining protein RodA [Hathewaya histolytica]|uniref:rod shape-determining protein RodA n=1 Tax=Hathewaya histolytica TaxID=1498 RepID=UPI003B66F97E